jgi:capsular exopolysaccharide synthesis family protein
LYSRRQLLTQAYGKLWAAKAPRLRELMSNSAGPKEALRAAQEKVVAITAEKEVIEAKLATIKIESKKTGEKQIELAILRTELSGKQNMLDKVVQRLEQLRFDQQSADSVEVLDKARPIGIPLNNKRNKMMAMAPVGMLGLVMGLFTLLELRAGRVGSPDELSSRVPVEVFSVPPLPVVRQSRGLKDARNNEAQFEAFVQQLDHLRVALCGEAAQQTGRGRCVLITSATGGEGKTTLAAQLAVRCAEAGARTVLIDADLRRPTLGKLFEVPECPGLSDVLREEAPLEDALVPISQVGGCQLLPAGSPEPNPNRVLRGQQFAPMLEHLRRNFDVIIIDTPPVLPVPDALIMGRYADGVVLAARHDRSRFPLVERANTLLTGAGIPVLGVVINGVRPSGMRYGQYAYSYRTDRSAEGGSVGRAG